MELAARELAGPDAPVEFSSAGTHGFREHPMDEPMAGTLTERGVERRDVPQPAADRAS